MKADLAQFRSTFAYGLRPLWLLLLLGVVAGCSTSRRSHSLWFGEGGPPTDIRVIRIHSKADCAPLNCRLPSTKGEASSRLAFEGLKVGTEPAGLLLLPLTVGGGALIGWLNGVTEVDSARFQAAITNAWSQLRPIDGLACELREAGTCALAVSWAREAAPTAQKTNPSCEGEYWLVIESLSLRLDPEREDNSTVNPGLRFVLEVSCSVKRATDRKELLYGKWTHKGSSHLCATWADADGKLLVAALQRGQRQLAKQIIDDLFSWVPNQ